MVAVALLKNENWGESRDIPAPILIVNQWVERPQNPRTIRLWENFDKDGLLNEFFEVMENPKLGLSE